MSKPLRGWSLAVPSAINLAREVPLFHQTVRYDQQRASVALRDPQTKHPGSTLFTWGLFQNAALNLSDRQGGNIEVIILSGSKPPQ